MKRKVAIGVASLMMTGMVFLPVHADDTSADMDVSYSEPSTYTLSIPKSVILASDQAVSKQITATQMNVEPSRAVKVTVTGGLQPGGIIQLDRVGDSSTKVQSILSLNSTPVDSNTIVAQFEGEDLTPTIGGTLSFSKITPTTGSNIKAGSYDGTVTFTMILENKSI